MPWTTARYRFSVLRAANCAVRDWCAPSFLAMTRQPDVSLSRRWTMPGRSTPPMPERSPQWWSRAFTMVPSGLPAAGCTTMPLSLLMTTTSSSSYRMSRGMSCGRASAGSGSGMRTVMESPRETGFLGLAGVPLTNTSPLLIRLWILERESSGRWAARYWSQADFPVGIVRGQIHDPWRLVNGCRRRAAGR